MRKQNQKNIIPKVEYLLSVYNTLSTPKAKNDMLKEVLEKVIYIKCKKVLQMQQKDRHLSHD